MLQEHLNLFAKQFSGETSEEENREIEVLLNENKQLRAEYSELVESWEMSLKLRNNFDTESGLHIFKTKLKRQKILNRKNMLLRIAAIFIGLVFVSSVLWIDYTKHTTIVATNSVEKITLPDSSTIFLSKGSEIEYRSARLWKFNRNVKLSGEAYFEIKKKSGKKFIVNVNCFDVQVLGTKFNIKTTPRNSEIVLKEGTVRLFNFPEIHDDIYMAPNDFVAYNKTKNKFTRSKVNAKLYTLWKDKFINFDNFTLVEVGKLIEQMYGKKVIVKNKTLAGKTLSGSAPNDNLDDLLNALSKILGEEIINQNDTIVIN